MLKAQTLDSRQHPFGKRLDRLAIGRCEGVRVGPETAQCISWCSMICAALWPSQSPKCSSCRAGSRCTGRFNCAPSSSAKRPQRCSGELTSTCHGPPSATARRICAQPLSVKASSRLPRRPPCSVSPWRSKSRIMPGGPPPRPRQRSPSAHAAHRPGATAAPPRQRHCPHPGASPRPAGARPAVQQARPCARVQRLMSEQQPGPTLRVEAHCHERSDTADKAIHQHRDTRLRTTYVGTDQRRDLETANTAQYLQRVFSTQAMQAQRPLDDFSLVLYPGVVQASARAAQLRRRTPQQNTRQAAADVVLPMPISPPMNSCAPCSAPRWALSRPACKAACSWFSVIAG